MRVVWLVLAALALSMLFGCATSMNVVKVPVPVECRQAIPPRPVMPTEQFTKKPGIDAWIRAAMAEIERREAYEIELRAALEACTKPLA